MLDVMFIESSFLGILSVQDNGLLLQYDANDADYL